MSYPAARPAERFGLPACAAIGIAVGAAALAALELQKDLSIFTVLVLFLFPATLWCPDRTRAQMILMILSFCVGRSFYVGEVYAGHHGGSQGLGEFFLSDVWLMLLLASWGTSKGDGGVKGISRLDCAVLALLLWCLVSVVAAGGTLLGFADLLRIVKVTLLYFYLSRNLRDETEVKIVCYTLLFTLAAQALSIIYMYLGGTMPFNHFQNAEMEEAELFTMRRIGGTLGITGTAVFFELMIPLAISFIFFAAGRALTLLAWPLFVLGMISVVFTASRTSIAVLFLAVLILWPWAFLRERARRVQLLSFAAVFLVLMAFFAWMALPRLEASYMNHSMEARGSYTVIAKEIIADRPVFGVGLNSFYENAPRYSGFRGAVSQLYGVHNVYLSFGAETGLAGIVILGWIFVEALVFAFTNQRRGTPFVRALSLGIAAALCGSFLISSNLGMGFKYLYTIWSYLWLFLALLAAMHRMVKKEGNAAGGGTPAKWREGA
ncbi:O-antigen ligase family protein [Geomonas sp. RF6]|uniref:O-antigen ligase family protein n=1 Tax=Geomonas sp. RF6 TaxID=2897342 RepID=UPI001E2BE3DB|nr:O-antigen ligase family protein [Geomonas sp. RF6]UFS69342.1 O-antigen ligase family protein [Geomonas sp. RF6]